MTNDFKAAEAQAPINQNGPLPLDVNTLQFIPAERRGQYERTMTGSFRLAYVHVGDEVNRKAHDTDLLDGKLKMLPDGETPETQLEAARVAEQMQQSFIDELARLEAVDADERKAALVAEQDRRRAEVAAEFAEQDARAERRR